MGREHQAQQRTVWIVEIDRKRGVLAVPLGGFHVGEVAVVVSRLAHQVPVTLFGG